MTATLRVLIEVLGILVGLLLVYGGVVLLTRTVRRARRPPSEPTGGAAPWIPHPTGFGRGPDAPSGPSTFPFPPAGPAGGASGDLGGSDGGPRGSTGENGVGEQRGPEGRLIVDTGDEPAGPLPDAPGDGVTRPHAGLPSADRLDPDRAGGTAQAPAARVEARALVWRWSGIVVGSAAAYLVMASGSLGRGVLLAAPVFGICAVAGALAGELATLPPVGAVRRAELRVRRVRDYLPKWLSRIVAAGAVLLVALAAVTTAVASGDDMGRAGRYLFCAAGAGAGPWPGSYYTVPALVAVAAGLVLTGLSLRRVVRRPRPAASAEADDSLRRRSAEVVTAATGILVLVPLLGVALTAGFALHSLAGPCGHPWWSGAGGALEVLAVLAFLGAAQCLAVLLLGPVRARVARV